ncbi:MAG TPA: glycerol-3-phosphate dehydrogenase/oxidase [Pirellulales bacterium]|jgi:glycerol-3-phosphate dehydrogenase|nr:glycerol-3-phosphate dehydrogenase/oxidase [Pirellulales bacterium]
MAAGSQTIVILGAGINGCALARELALNGLSVVLVDTADVASGTTSYSSRLIHGGLRYLEYGDFALVRESLAERGRLLRLAPQFVRPLELFVPIRTRFSGLWQSALRFFGRDTAPAPRGRGLLLVWLGLMLYDAYARDPSVPKHRLHKVATDGANSAGTPPVNPREYHWLASYYDAQVTYPERLTLALLADASQAAAAHGQSVQVFTYHQARLDRQHVSIMPVGTDRAALEPFQPAAIVNATGAWVDETLRRLEIPTERLMGGTKGSHFVTPHPALAAALGGRAIYAEAHDGRPVFILPWAGQTLVGTTDEAYTGDPRSAVASPAELAYLLDAVRYVFPQFPLSTADVALSYAGVRPLAYTGAAASEDTTTKDTAPTTTPPAAITREHFFKRHAGITPPTYSIVGGKLTTCRSLAEETAATLLADLGRTHAADSRERTIPGGEAWPTDAGRARHEIAQRTGLPPAVVDRAWQLVGTQTATILSTAEAPAACLRGTEFPLALALWSIRHEWVTRLADLVERRLMLLYQQPLQRTTLEHLVELLVAEGRIDAAQAEREVSLTIERLGKHFGKQVA